MAEHLAALVDDQRADTRKEQKQVYADPARDAPPLGAGPLGSLGSLLGGDL